MFSLRGKKLELPTAAAALAGRTQAMSVPARHFVNGNRLQPPFPQGLQIADFGLGCFWGPTNLRNPASPAPPPSPSSSRHGHDRAHRGGACDIRPRAEVSFDELLQVFWESHDPTQGMRQGNDIGTQYRSSIYWHDAEQRAAAERSAEAYGSRLQAAGHGPSRPRSGKPPISFTPRTTTSNTSPRTQAVIADWVAPACHAQSASAWIRRADFLPQSAARLSSAGARPDSRLPSDRSALRRPAMAAAGNPGRA